MRMIALVVVAALCGLIGTVASAQGEWIDDFDKALAKAKESGKPVLADFSGSDWCGWCVKLEKEVFSQKEFKDYASKSLVCALVDFPKDKEQRAELKKMNRTLMEKYKVEGFPTVLVLDSNGKELGRTGYMEGGPEAFIAQLKKIIGAKAK